MDDLRSWWEVPSIAHFCSLFRSAFDLTDFDIEDLEEGFLLAQTDDGSAFILDLLCRLLNGCYGRKDITITNFDLYVKDIIKYKWDTTDNPIKEKSEFKALTLREKVELIYAICEYRLDTEDVVDQLKGFEGDSMRVEPLGKDKNGALYWYFYGTRLYMEDPEPKKELTKEEKRAKDRQKRMEAKKKKQEGKRQRKEEKKKLKALRKVEKKKKLEEAAKNQKKIEESNTRRSGRLRTRKIEIPESSSSESSSSSEEEEETEVSSEEEVEEEKVEPKRGKGKSRKPPAKTPAKRETANQRAGSPKKGTSTKGKRSSSRRQHADKTPQKAPDKTQQSNSNTRRSSRLRKKPEPPPLPSPYNSETEEENDYDIDSGHESGGSLRSEASKASTARKSLQSVKLTSRRPTVNVALRRDLSQTEDDEGESDEKDEDSYTAGDAKGDDKYNSDDEGKEVQKDSVHDDDKGDNKVTSTDDGKRENATSDNEDKEDKTRTGVNEVVVKEEEKTENNSEEGNVIEASDSGKSEEGAEPMEIMEKNTKSHLENSVEINQEVSKDNQTNEIFDKPEELEKNIETCETKGLENDSNEVKKNQDFEMVSNAHVDKETEENVAGYKGEVSVKAEEDVQVYLENEKMEVDSDDTVNEEYNKDEIDKNKDNNAENKNTDIENEDVKVKIEDEDKLSNDIGDASFKRVLRKRNMEEEKEEANNSEDENDDKGSKVEKQSQPRVFTLSEPAVAPTPSNSSTRWHLVCQTLDDWVNLAEWFNDSDVRCEKSLSKVIREDFLPVLPEIIEAREKEKQKRLLQEQELRRSNRITMKMKEKMEQEKILAEALAEEEKARIKAEEERKLKEEQLRLEEENRQREERRKAREERAKRLSMREERARLLAEGKEIPPEMIYTGSNKYRDDGEDSDDSRCDLKEEEDYESLMKVINAMKYHKDCWPFLEPVTDEQAPGYSDVIKRPMDLSKIEEKVENRDYRSTQHFLSDFRLMFNNCKRFNGQDSEFSDCARSMENMLKKYMKRFVSEEPTDKYYEDKPFVLPGGRGARPGEKRYRPQRAASSRALQTVQKALHSDEEETESEDERDVVPARKKSKEGPSETMFKTQSHHNLLLQEMIELKRQREKKLAASALHNHGVITRGPERIRMANPQGGVMIIPKSEMNSTGVLRMAATREIKRKVASQPQLPNLAPLNRQGKLPIVHTGGRETVVKADLSKKEPGLSIVDQTTPGSNQPKTIRIVASNANGQPSVKQTAESVKVSADGYLIISGKNSGIKVTENTKIVIQPPGGSTPSAEGASQLQAASKEILIKKIPTLSNLRQVPGLNLSGMTSMAGSTVQNTAGSTVPGPSQVPSQVVSSVSPANQMPIQQQVSLQRLLKQTASNPQLSQQQAALQGFVNQMGEKGQLTPDMKKKLDIAQRILHLNQQKRKFLEQQKSQQQQNGPAPGVNPPKIIKLDVGAGAVNSSAIEERLRDPSVNIDNQLGSVSQNVISNVNIASDILDTYYSVLNDAKSKASASVQQNVSAVSVTLQQSTAPLTQNVGISQSLPRTNISQLPTTIQGVVLQQQQPSTVATTPENTKPAPVQGNMSEVTRQIYNLISKSGSGGLVSALAKAQMVKPNTPTLVKQVDSEQSGSPLIQTSSVPSQGVTVADLVSQGGLNTQSVTSLTSSSSISDLLRSALGNAETKNTEVSPIEALFAGNTQVKTETDSISKPSSQYTLVQALATKTPITVNPTPQKVSPEKNERQNLFDTFETSKTNVNSTAVAGELSVPGQSESSEVSKEVKLKLKADGMSLPSSSTLNFGSPLKTSSVLEALKGKLQTVKPQIQSSELQSSAENAQSLCFCSGLASCNSPASSDLLCELQPSCMHFNTAIEVLSSTINPACVSSVPYLNSSVEIPNIPAGLLHDANSHKCSLVSPYSVQSENILQNFGVEKSKMTKISDFHLEDDEMLTAIPLEKFLQKSINKVKELDEYEKKFHDVTDDRSLLMIKSKKELENLIENVDDDILKGNEGIKGVSEKGLKSVAVISEEIENKREKEKEKEEHMPDDIDSKFIQPGVMKTYMERVGDFLENDTANTRLTISLGKDLEKKELKRSESVNNENVLSLKDNQNRIKDTNGNIENVLNKNEMPIELIVKKVPYINDNQMTLNTDESKECFILVPSIPPSVSVNSETQQVDSVCQNDNGYLGKMSEQRLSFRSPWFKKRGYRKRYGRITDKPIQEVEVAFQPFVVTSKINCLISVEKHNSGNAQSVVKDKSRGNKVMISKSLGSVTLNNPLMKVTSKNMNNSLMKVTSKNMNNSLMKVTSKNMNNPLMKVTSKNSTEADHSKISLNRDRGKENVLHLQNGPVKAYKILGPKPNFSRYPSEITSSVEIVSSTGINVCNVNKMRRKCKMNQNSKGNLNNNKNERVSYQKHFVDCQLLQMSSSENSFIDSSQSPLNKKKQEGLVNSSQNNLFEHIETSLNKEARDSDTPLSRPVNIYKILGTKSNTFSEKKKQAIPSKILTPACKTICSDKILDAYDPLHIQDKQNQMSEDGNIDEKKVEKESTKNKVKGKVDNATLSQSFCFEWKNVSNMPDKCKKSLEVSNEIDDHPTEKEENQASGYPVMNNTTGEDELLETHQDLLFDSRIGFEMEEEVNTCSENTCTTSQSVAEPTSVETCTVSKSVQKNSSNPPDEQVKFYKVKNVTQDSSEEKSNHRLKTVELAEVSEALKDSDEQILKIIMAERSKLLNIDSSNVNDIENQNSELTPCPGTVEENSVKPLAIPKVDSFLGIKSADKNDLHSILLSSPSLKTNLNKIKVVERFEEGANSGKVKLVRIDSEPLKMYKIAGIKSSSFAEKFCQELQTIDLTPIPDMHCSDGKVSEKANVAFRSKERKPKTVKNRPVCRKNNTSVTNFKKQDILFDACQVLKNSTNEDENLDLLESPFFEGDIGIESEMPLSDFDINQIFNEDFFSTELYSPVYSSNLFYGDGFSIDSDLEKIEIDVFELQDRSATPSSTVGNLLPEDQNFPSASADLDLCTVNSNLNTNSLEASQGVISSASNSGSHLTVPAVVPCVTNANVLSSMPTVQTSLNVVQNTIPIGVSPGLLRDNATVEQTGTVQIPTVVMQDDAQQGLLPTTVQKESVNVSQVTSMQGHQVLLPTVLQKESVNVPQVTAVQVSLPQTQIQVPAALLAALQQVTGGLTVNQTPQNALQQQFNVLVSNCQSNLQLGAQNTNVMNSFPQISQLQTTNRLNQQPFIQSHADSKVEPMLQSSMHQVQSSNISQYPEVNYTDVVSSQNDNLMQEGMEFDTGSRSRDVNTAVTCNINNVNPVGEVTDGKNEQTTLSLTQTDEESVATNQAENSSLTEATQIQFVHNQ